LIDGKKIAAEVVAELKAKKQNFAGKKMLGILLGDNAASLSFLRQKQQTASELGIQFEVVQITVPITEDALVARVKTLTTDAAVLGAIVGTRSETKIQKIRRFGAALGLAFQVADDIMDRDGYLQLMSAGQARKKVEALIQRAKQEAVAFGKKGGRLLELADFILGSIP